MSKPLKDKQMKRRRLEQEISDSFHFFAPPTNEKAENGEKFEEKDNKVLSTREY